MSHDGFRDLGKLRVTGDEPMYYELAEELPEEGDKIFWVEFGEDADDAMEPRVRKGKVVTYLAGYVVVDEAPNRGASGSCLFNEAGEVFGLMVWGINRGTSEAGVGVLLLP